jgi:hypothetical protein
MATKAEIRSEVVKRRREVYALLQEPMTVAELCDRTGINYATMQCHITAFIDKEIYIKEVTPKHIYKDRQRVTYVATKDEYLPEEQLVPVVYKPRVEASDGEEDDIDDDKGLPPNTRYIRFDTRSTRSKDLAKKLKESQQNRNSQRAKQNVWIGCTAAMV